MEIKIDTKHDSHEDIRKVIKMLQHLVGDSQEIFTNQPSSQSNIQQDTGSAFNNIFGDASAQNQAAEEAAEKTEETDAESSESAEDLFAELFSEEEIEKMSQAEVKDEEEEDKKAKSNNKKYDIEFY